MTQLQTTLETGDGARFDVLHGPLDALPATAPVLLFWPAMGVKANYYVDLIAPFAARGFRLLCAELRGHGSSSERAGWRTNFGFNTLIEQEYEAAIRWARGAFPDARLLLGGHSLGGQLSVLRAAAYPTDISGVVTVAACSVYWRAFPGAPKLLASTQLVSAVAHLSGHWPGARFGFAGREARGVVRDWAHQSRTGRYAPKGATTDYEAALAVLKVPALLVSLAGDDLAPAPAVDHLAGKLKSARFTRRHIEEAAISDSAKPHFHWVRSPEAIIETIAEWHAP